MYLHAYDYIFAFGVIFAFLDAWNIGANDVANSFATSVSSRSLTMLQAMCIASVMEFAGSIGVGARVADTIRTKVIDPKLYTEDPAVLMLAMVCAVIGSSLYLTMASKLGLPVSTTHSIMGGVIGAGVASIGASRVSWGWNGVSQVFVAWVAAPGIAGAFGAIIFLLNKYLVLERKNSQRYALISVPIWFTVTAASIAMLLIWKGASSKIGDMSDGELAGSIIGTGFGVGLLVCIFFLPYVYRKVIVGDWQLKAWHVALGPLLLRRPAPPPKPVDQSDGIVDYYAGHLTAEQLEAKDAARIQPTESKDIETGEKGISSVDSDHASDAKTPVTHAPHPIHKSIVGPKPEGKLLSIPVLFWWVKYGLLRGVDRDVVSAQAGDSKLLSGDLDRMHARVSHYDNKTEYMYSFLQVMTASAASFAHGANDVSNAIGPFATIYDIWSTGAIHSKSPVPIWILAFGGAAIVIGLWTYGYNIMRNLGNRITLHSPSRGFSMELGAALTVIMATRLAIPVSTTQCITGATVGVGLCAGDWRAINWRMVAWIYGGWIITLPVTGLISGCLLGVILNAPQWGNSISA